MYSGIHVFCNYGGTHPNCSMTEAQFEALAIGDVVSLTGTFSNYTPTTPTGAPPEIEIDSPNITNAGTTMTPTAVDVPAATLISTQATASGAAPYEGAYVHVTGGPFTVSNVAAAEYSATCTSTAGVAGTTFDGFEATSGGNTFDIGLTYYYNVTYCLPDCGYACTNQVTATEAFTSLSGIVEPESNATGGQVYLQISPTQDSDLVKM